MELTSTMRGGHTGEKITLFWLQTGFVPLLLPVTSPSSSPFYHSSSLLSHFHLPATSFLMRVCLEVSLGQGRIGNRTTNHGTGEQLI